MVDRFKATIDGNKIFMREYEVKGETSLYSFHRFLQNDLGFAPDQLVLFRGLSKDNKVKSEFGLFDMGDGPMDKVSVENAVKKGEITLSYVYETFKERSIRLEFLATEESLARRSYPRLVAERGWNPDQFSDNYDDFDPLIPAAETDVLFDSDELPEGEELA